VSLEPHRQDRRAMSATQSTATLSLPLESEKTLDELVLSRAVLQYLPFPVARKMDFY
jgi:hypothetical protein